VIDQVSARATVDTRVGGAFVDLGLTDVTSVARARTLVGSDDAGADTSVQTASREERTAASFVVGGIASGGVADRNTRTSESSEDGLNSFHANRSVGDRNSRRARRSDVSTAEANQGAERRAIRDSNSAESANWIKSIDVGESRNIRKE
jgi:hypothetical protein